LFLLWFCFILELSHPLLVIVGEGVPSDSVFRADNEIVGKKVMQADKWVNVGGCKEAKSSLYKEICRGGVRANEKASESRGYNEEATK
jgi:hypothetical protein